MSDGPSFFPGWRMPLALLSGVLMAVTSHAAEKTLEVGLWELPEKAWQETFSPLSNDGTRLYEELQKTPASARSLASTTLVLKPEAKTEWKNGADVTYATEYQQEDVPTRVKVTGKETRFVGTLLEAEVTGMDESGVSLNLQVNHEYAPPAFYPVVYGTGAQGADRTAQSISLPVFKTMDWQGSLVVPSSRWLLAASLTEQHEATRRSGAEKRLLVMIRLPAAPDREVRSAMTAARQRIIRAPELAVAALLADPVVQEREILARLDQMVQEGKARVVSDVQTAAAASPGQQTIETGDQRIHGTEMEPDYENLIMLPVGFDEYHTGTSLIYSAQDLPDGLRKCDWNSTFSALGPASFLWPVVWPYDGQKTPGWWEENDRFEAALHVPFIRRGGRPGIAAVMPPAESVWPGTRERWLDVFEARMNQPGSLAPESAKDDEQCRFSLFALDVDESRALQIAADHKPSDHGSLLRSLLEECKDQQSPTRLRQCLSVRADTEGSALAESGRMHAHPVETQTFPSAWDHRRVGHSLEVRQDAPGNFSMAVDGTPSAPRMAEWPMCLDRPMLVAWQPVFRRQMLNTQAVVPASGGCRLIGVERIPDMLAGSHAPQAAGRSVLYFACSTGAGKASPKTDVDAPPSDPVRISMAEFLAFELPGAAAADWPPVGEAEEVKRWEDPKGLQRLLDLVKTGGAKLAAHSVVQVISGTKSWIGDTEEVPHVTGFDPAEQTQTPARYYRPTAFDTAAVGSSLEVEVVERSSEDGKSGIFSVQYLLHHDTAHPQEPTLQEILAANPDDRQQVVPEARKFALEWHGQAELVSGSAICLGVQSAPAPGREPGDRCIVAFLRIRDL